MFKILQYSEMECNCVMKITEGLFIASTVRYDRISVKVQSQFKNIIHLFWRPPKC